MNDSKAENWFGLGVMLRVSLVGKMEILRADRRMFTESGQGGKKSSGCQVTGQERELNDE